MRFPILSRRGRAQRRHNDREKMQDIVTKCAAESRTQTRMFSENGGAKIRRGVAPGLRAARQSAASYATKNAAATRCFFYLFAASTARSCNAMPMIASERRTICFPPRETPPLMRRHFAIRRAAHARRDAPLLLRRHFALLHATPVERPRRHSPPRHATPVCTLPQRLSKDVVRAIPATAFIIKEEIVATQQSRYGEESECERLETGEFMPHADESHRRACFLFLRHAPPYNSTRYRSSEDNTQKRAYRTAARPARERRRHAPSSPAPAATAEFDPPLVLPPFIRESQITRMARYSVVFDAARRPATPAARSPNAVLLRAAPMSRRRRYVVKKRERVPTPAMRTAPDG